MNINKEFQLLNGFGENVLLECSTGRYYRIYDNEVYSHINNYFTYDIRSNMAEEIVNSIKSNTLRIEERNKIINSKDFIINRLAIVLTSNCNLRCKYCYANFGMYDYEESNIISIDILRNSIEYFSNEFKQINTIQFFGGEPTLCTDSIKYVIGKFEELVKLKKINNLPRFSIVTNGLYISKKLIHILKKYNMIITLSIDGPKSVNDLTRIDPNNKGSYDRVIHTYNCLKESGIENIGIECTYTNEHLKQDISLVNIVEFFDKEFGIKVIHVVPVSIEDSNYLSVKNNELKFYKYVEELVDYTFNQLIGNRLLKSTNIVLGLLQNIITNNIKPDICPAGIGTFSISHDNKISPCFMYTSTTDLAYGEVGCDGSYILNKAYEFNNKFNNKNSVDKCKVCFARSMCSSCLGVFEVKNNKTKEISDIYCNMIKIAAKNILLKISNIKSDKMKWDEFISLIKGDTIEG